MKGWRDEEVENRTLMAPCGLYCGTCAVYLAHRDRNEKFRAKIAAAYGSSPAETKCAGCMQPDPPDCLFGFCRSCPIRECVRAKGYYSCHQCSDFPCPYIENFPIPVGRRVMPRAIAKWRECVAELGDHDGSVAWARSECERYHCPDCGHPLFRGAIRCRGCGQEVADRLDGRN